jgi:hypothetical protein
MSKTPSLGTAVNPQMVQKLATESPGRLIRVLYYSKANIKGSPTDLAREYAQILATAQRNNSRVGITGALLASGNRFAQVLEGPADAIYSTFERIKLDRRHRYTTLLKAEPAVGRVFGSWAMALAGLGPGEAVSLGADTSLRRAITDPARASDPLIALLLNLVQTSETPNISTA